MIFETRFWGKAQILGLWLGSVLLTVLAWQWSGILGRDGFKTESELFNLAALWLMLPAISGTWDWFTARERTGHRHPGKVVLIIASVVLVTHWAMWAAWVMFELQLPMFN